ncbi:hypothetical protein DL770_010018 [Monosporascus sp. CRB-9-2]|nr:hypothetical protein DL770_010018 [Monosporascus sp. CRB-9-2]
MGPSAAPRDILGGTPDGRFNAEGFYDPDGLDHGTSNVRHSYTLSGDHHALDTQFFGVKPVEASAMDPKQRILLEATMLFSLVALHQAVQSLRNGVSCIPIVTGCNLLLGPDQYVAESNLQMLSPSGGSRMWDKDADGYARGDRFGILVLKTLSKALADQDAEECIIRETGINQDGRTKATAAGDPIEAQTVLGHSEGAAGVAGVLKASLALQNEIIPSDLLFTSLIPK